MRACMPIAEESDVAIARAQVREFARWHGLSESAIEALVTATSEIVRNVVVHAKTGELLLGSVETADRRGVMVQVRDAGPGIHDLEQAFADGYSTGQGLGLGLSSAKRLTDEFQVVSKAGMGTTVIMTKWAR